MSIIIAKKYVKALLDQRDISEVTEINEQLQAISSAYKYEKFNTIVSSIDVSSNSKVELINSFIQNKNNNLTNLIKLLGRNKRLNIIPMISKELNHEVSILKNNYSGIVYSNETLSEEYMNNICKNLAKKFNAELTLTNIINGYDGIKVEIEDLGVEISFAKNIFKSQIIEHIIKAV